MTSPARIASWRALAAIATGGRDLPSALAASREHLKDDRDRGLTAAIVHGTLRWQRAFDFLIEHYSTRPLDALDADVVIILRLSLYQLLHLDRVPAAAVVDDAVSLARKAGRSSATGFVNAVLRTTLRQRNQLPLPERPADPAMHDELFAYLGVTLSHPDWLVRRWLARVGADAAERWVTFNNQAAPLTLNTNRLRTTRDRLAIELAAGGIETEPTRFAPDGLRVTSGNPLQRGPGDHFFVQDEASQLVALAVNAKAGERILDLCAAPGGKTIAMAGDMNGSGAIVACDVRPRRVRLLTETIRQAGARHVHPVQVAATGPLPFADVFDRVLVDAPCSGLGTVRRDPDIKWRRHEGDLQALADRQIALLERAATAVRRGGRLFYATCSSEPEENEMVVDRFLAVRPDFHLVDLRAEGRAEIAAMLDDRGLLRTRPFVDELEAFFGAALRRT